MRRDRYSRFVAWVKVLLPLAALGLLSTIFMFAGQVDPTQSIPYAELNVEEIAREQRLSAPYFSGVTNDGAAVAISASVARQAKGVENGIEVEEIEARFDMQTGVDVRVHAPIGLIDNGTQIARLDGGARLTTSDGYDLATAGLTARLDNTRITSGALIGSGPIGRVSAGAMELTRDLATGHQLLVFKDGVKLIYQVE